jgi:hypothetical protein
MGFVIVSLWMALWLNAGVAIAQDNQGQDNQGQDNRGQDNRLRTRPVTGTFRASPVEVNRRLCEGQDGLYMELRGQWAGTSASSDPRLSGRLEFTTEPALVNVNTGFGTFIGRFKIVDPVSGAHKVEGEFRTVITEASLNHGFALGKVISRGAGEAETFWASFKSVLDVSLNVTGQFGGLGDARTPAVIQGGQCKGRFTDVQ